MRAARLRRGLAMALTACSIVVTVAAAARSTVPGTPVPPRLPAMRAETLPARYAANHRFITESEHAARALGDEGRAGVLARLARGDRHFLSFSPRGDGQVVEVLGDLAHADRIAVVVPGSDTTVDTFDELGTVYASLNGGARSLHAEMRKLQPDRKTAVVAWYGYPAPRTMSRDIVTTDRALDGGRRLAGLVGDLRRVNAAAPVAVLCHSYGSVVCATALRRMDAPAESSLSDVVLFGSPGTGVRSRAELRTRVPVWAGRGATDWIEGVPHVSLDLLGAQIGFGTDPVAAPFGARLFPAGAGSHSDYLRPGGLPLRNIALIALGRGSEVSDD
ncbi:alpha/beta hydrolase [Streptomyces sp. NPDC058773]|uniref:alpha/beta hydrolase n=1 Tax=Streptomyces sp. NPDC058773 TaxID=3346632 RepID=UPI003676E861